MPDKDEYLDSVTQEISFKAARKYLRRELEMHIEDKTQEFAAADNANAEQLAVASMGDAKEAGRALNAVHRPRTEWGVIACALLLAAAGFLILWFGRRDDIHFSGPWSSNEHLFILFLGACLSVSAYFFNYTLIIKLRYVFFGCALVFIGLYILDGNGMNDLFPYALSSQSTVVSFSTLLFILGMVGFVGKRKGQRFAALLPVIAMSALAMLAMGFIGATFYSLMIAVVSIAVISYLIFSSENKIFVRLLHLITTVCVLALVQILLTKISFYSLINAWTWETAIGDGYAYPAFLSEIIGGAKFIGPSDYYMQYQTASLHASGTSNILASIIICFGWGTALSVSLVFAAMFAFLINRIIKIEHSFGKALAVGVCAYLFIRFAVCILTNTGIVWGVSCGLPLISYGYTGLLADSLLIGLFLSVWRRSTFMKDSIILKPAVK